jgi:RNA binding activity-knot of a chromodomain
MGLRGGMFEDRSTPTQETATVPSGEDSNPQSVPSHQSDDIPLRPLNTSGPNLRSRNASCLPQVEKLYRITQRDGSAAIGEVLASRHSARTKAMEFFVHYDGQNRRLDEWIGIDRFVEEANSAPSHVVTPTQQTSASALPSDLKTASKITRSARRKFDEINHIQPSLAELLPSQVGIRILFLMMASRNR